MKISSIVGKDKLTLSFEVFPPKTDSDFEKVKEAAFGVAAIKPAYISVTLVPVEVQVQIRLQ